MKKKSFQRNSVTYGMPCHAIGHFVFYYHHVTYRMPCHASGHLVIYHKCYGFERAFFTLRRFFTLHSVLLVLRLPWGPAVQLQGQQGFMLIFETQLQLEYLFESQQSTKELYYVGCIYGLQLVGYVKNLLLTEFQLSSPQAERLESLMFYLLGHRATQSTRN